jgi:ferric-dicitrate binding protein FerR (iron transport regulator)
VILDNKTTSNLARQGNTTIINKDGQLTYINKPSAESAESKVVFNTLETGKGQTFSTVLSDGSKIWLNSGSKVRYPVTFLRQERKVLISGEAYFEVAKSDKPFIVSSLEDSDWKVQVLGTHFNINAYTDEQAIKTTLLEGKVKMLSDKSEVILMPGQQAELSRSKSKLNTINNVDVEQITAWKNGYFQFKNEQLSDLMKKISRWYDVEVEYKEPVSSVTFSGRISRSNKLSSVLTVLEQSDVHFIIQGKKIIIK